MRALLFILVFCTATLSAGSLRLYNDSPFKLRATIRAADGTYLGEMVILPEHTTTWSSEYPSFGPGGQNYSENPSRSMTPYTVFWSCMDGGDYGVSSDIATGALVSASASSGSKYCKPPKKQSNTSPTAPYGAQEGDEQLHEGEGAEMYNQDQ